MIALVIPTLLSLWIDSIARVKDAGGIPTGIPLSHIPYLALVVDPAALVGVLTVALIVLVQGVGVCEAAPNLDRSAGSCRSRRCASTSTRTSPLSQRGT